MAWSRIKSSILPVIPKKYQKSLKNFEKRAFFSHLSKEKSRLKVRVKNTRRKKRVVLENQKFDNVGKWHWELKIILKKAKEAIKLKRPNDK